MGHQVCEKTDNRVVDNNTVVLRADIDSNTINAVNISDIIPNTLLPIYAMADMGSIAYCVVNTTLCHPANIQSRVKKPAQEF